MSLFIIFNHEVVDYAAISTTPCYILLIDVSGSYFPSQTRLRKKESMDRSARIERINRLPEKSFVLLGPRGTGKSTWLRAVLPEALFIDLLDSERYLQFSRNPSDLVDLVSPLLPGSWVVIDEIQRLPMLLNEVHRIYESGRGIHFALSGSSARKLRREGANLLAGRALQEWMFPFLYPEYAPGWTIAEACEWGTLPLVVSDPQHRARTLAACWSFASHGRACCAA